MEEGYGRTKIARILNGQNLHISEASVGNIIRAYRRSLQLSHEQSLQQESSCIDTVMTPQSQGPEATTISTGIDMSYIGSPLSTGVGLKPTTVVRDGGPLSHLLKDTTAAATAVVDSICKDTTPPAPAKPSRNLLIKDPELNIEPAPDDNINQDVWKNETVKTKEEKIGQHQSRSSLSNTQNPEPQITWDPDSDDSWDRNFFKRVMDQRAQNIHELELIENGKRELEEEREQIGLMKQSVRQEINDLKVRGDKLKEIELLIPLARQLQIMKVDVRNFIPWSEMVQDQGQH